MDSLQLTHLSNQKIRIWQTEMELFELARDEESLL